MRFFLFSLTFLLAGLAGCGDGGVTLLPPPDEAMTTATTTPAPATASINGVESYTPDGRGRRVVRLAGNTADGQQPRQFLLPGIDEEEVLENIAVGWGITDAVGLWPGDESITDATCTVSVAVSPETESVTLTTETWLYFDTHVSFSALVRFAPVALGDPLLKPTASDIHTTVLHGVDVRRYEESGGVIATLNTNSAVGFQQQVTLPLDVATTQPLDPCMAMDATIPQLRLDVAAKQGKIVVHGLDDWSAVAAIDRDTLDVPDNLIVYEFQVDAFCLVTDYGEVCQPHEDGVAIFDKLAGTNPLSWQAMQTMQGLPFAEWANPASGIRFTMQMEISIYACEPGFGLIAAPCEWHDGIRVGVQPFFEKLYTDDEVGATTFWWRGMSPKDILF